VRNFSYYFNARTPCFNKTINFFRYLPQIVGGWTEAKLVKKIPEKINKSPMAMIKQIKKN